MADYEMGTIYLRHKTSSEGFILRFAYIYDDELRLISIGELISDRDYIRYSNDYSESPIFNHQKKHLKLKLFLA